MVVVIIISVVIVVVSYIVYHNFSVMKANKQFYYELLERGVNAALAKRIMNQENKVYQDRIKSGERGLSLRDHLEEVLEKF